MHKTCGLVLVLALGSVRGDVGDVDCSAKNATDEPLITQGYCKVQRLADDFVDPLLSEWWFGSVLGWCLVLFYHVVCFAEAYAKKFNDAIEAPFNPLLQKTVIEDYAKVCRLFGQQLLVYWAYFGPRHAGWVYLLHRDPFLHSLVLIMIDTLGLWLAREVLQAVFLGNGWIASLFGQHNGDENPLGVSERTTIFQVRTIYALPGGSALQDDLTWLTQTALFGLYVMVMNDAKKTIQARFGHHCLTWVVGALTICSVAEQQAGDNFCPGAWSSVIKAEPDGSLRARRSLAKWRARGRCFLDWSVNAVYRQVLLCTTPVLLCTENPMDFIKDVLAIAFIATLDDPDDARKDDSNDKIFDFVSEKRPSFLNDEQEDHLNGKRKDELVASLDPDQAANVWINMFASMSESRYGLHGFCGDLWGLLTERCGRLARGREGAHASWSEGRDEGYHELE